MFGPRFSSSYAFLLDDGTRGGIIIVDADDIFTLTGIHTSANTISATITMRSEGVTWSLTCVYGPQGEPEKVDFIEELKQLQPFVRLVASFRRLQPYRVSIGQEQHQH
jgi:hypothetical protein